MVENGAKPKDNFVLWHWLDAIGAHDINNSHKTYAESCAKFIQYII